MRHGDAGGSAAVAHEVGGTISGFQVQGRNVDQSNVAAQQRAHVAGEARQRSPDQLEHLMA